MLLGQSAHLAKVEPIIMNTALITCVVLAFFASNAECTISVWTEPSIANASGSGVFSTSSVNEAATYSVTVAATGAAPVTYALGTKTPDVAWAINTTSGALTIAAGILDYETATKYVVVVVATDSGSTKGTATCTVSITNVNEAPAFTGTSLTATIADGAAAGTTLGTYAATDPDTGDTVTYSIFSGNTNTDFTIGSTGVITVATGKTLSKATTPSYSMVLKAMDNDGTPLTGSSTVSVTVVPLTESTTVSVTVSSGTAAITACFITVIIGIFINVMK